MIISDHGFGPLSYDIYIEEWLEKEGFLSIRSDESVKRTTEDLLATTLKAGWQAVQRANLAGTVKSILPASWFEFGSVIQNEVHRDTVWEETQAFFTTLSGQALYVNVDDTFSSGPVSRDQYDKVIEEVRESLRSIRHPDTGEELVEDVIRSDEVFEGWMLDSAPDLIVRTVPDYTMKGGRSESLVQPSAQNAHDRSGDHRTDGILIASGPSFGTGHTDDVSVVDIAPTLLYLHDTPIPASMDGTVVTELFSGTLLNERDVRTTEEYGRSDTGGRQWDEDEEAELEDRLSDMGYLD
jgi:predicted AlkP superfamily phosphohydrolase/phosphomutase